MLRIRLDKEKVRSRLLKTKKTFFIEGWVPARVTEKAAAILEENGCYYRFRDPEEGEDVPVLMENKNFFVPFESITEMYSLPDYRGFDPTSIFAIFYAIFFGIMLSDAGYGILMAVACFIVLKKYDLEGGAYKLIKLFFWCGISTTFWGAMFGGWFGDFFQVFAKVAFGKELVIEPIWFNPINDPMKLLIFSLGLGIVHIFLGMGIKAYMLIRNGKWFDAICDVGFWYLLIIGLIAWLGGGMILPGSPIGEIGKWMSIAGAAGLLLTGGRNNKGIGKITGGLGALYNITSYLSDILSYSRLLALGLATGSIASVINMMGSMVGDNLVIKGIVLTLVFIVGHALNMAINVLGAYVHTNRLQFVVLFSKFYEGGGKAFEPLKFNTKFFKFKEENDNV
jgi:V/A-type H+-transporting ATPase subunit I